jgi:hypothetical protein
MTFNEIHSAIVAQTTWVANGGQPLCDDPTKTSGLKRLCTLFQLKYWKVII